MMLKFDWWRWLTITAFVCLMFFLFCRCTTTKYVPMVQYKEKVVCKTDSFIQADSIWLHDSIFIFQNGDTILTDRWHYRDRYKYIYKTLADTVVVHDSIPYKIEVEKPPSFAKGVLGSISMIVACILVIMAIFYVMTLVARKSS